MLTKCLFLVSFCSVLIAKTAQADVFHMASGLTSVEFVTVGNPGNAPDTRYNGVSVGAVDHAYQIGKYEITAAQYTEFLNAVAKADANSLYFPGFQQDGANIVQSGSSPNFSYSVTPDWANRLVNYVNLWDAVRFANWLSNGQPSGAQGAATTEGGAYHDVGNPLLFGRNPGARFFIPTEDEWYKAAYHNKSAGLAASYFDYPTGTNTAPINTLPDPGNHANFFDALGTGNHSYTIGSPYYRTEVGAFANSPSPYGTFDRGGNVEEYTETEVLGVSPVLSGGAYVGSSGSLSAASSRGSLHNTFISLSEAGFRIASIVPEPSTAVLAILTFGAICLWRKRFDA